MTGSTTCVLGASEHHFPGKERDTESGNDYMFARYYDSATGRFTSPDWSAKNEPVPYARLGNPQSLSLYSYVLNNPLALADIDGHAGCSLEGVASCDGVNAEGGETVEQHESEAQQQSGEGSASNVDKRTQLAGAAHDEAQGRDTHWAQGNGAPKCNVFVCDMLNKVGMNGPTYPGGNNPIVAGDWANPKFKIDNWRVLGSGEAPQPGDVAAYKEQFSNATGHSGIVFANVNGTPWVAAAGSKTIYATPAGSQYFGQGMNIVYRRYVGQ
jgi:RHS repeat-associated protein